MIVKSKIKKGDKVIVIAGKDKGKVGEVTNVYPTEQKLVVKDVNLVKRHQKATQTKEAGIVSKELPIHISNVAYLDPKESKPTKLGYKIEGGNKVRYCKLSGTVIA
jgi:large subunit ribosomal protein L24